MYFYPRFPFSECAQSQLCSTSLPLDTKGQDLRDRPFFNISIILLKLQGTANLYSKQVTSPLTERKQITFNHFSDLLTLLVELRILGLDQIRSLLCNHVDCVLDSAVWNDGEDGGVDDAKILDAVDLEVGVDDAFFDVLGEAGGSARICGYC